MPIQNPHVPSFFTWSVDGGVYLWTLEGARTAAFEVPLEQLIFNDDDGPNELAVVRASFDGTFFMAGDKTGTLRCVTKPVC